MRLSVLDNLTVPENRKLWLEGGRHSQYMDKIEKDCPMFLNVTRLLYHDEICDIFKLGVDVDGVYLTNKKKTIIYYSSLHNKKILYFKNRGEYNSFKLVCEMYLQKFPNNDFRYASSLVLNHYGVKKLI